MRLWLWGTGVRSARGEKCTLQGRRKAHGAHEARGLGEHTCGQALLSRAGGFGACGRQDGLLQRLGMFWWGPPPEPSLCPTAHPTFTPHTACGGGAQYGGVVSQVPVSDTGILQGGHVCSYKQQPPSARHCFVACAHLHARTHVTHTGARPQPPSEHKVSARACIYIHTHTLRRIAHTQGTSRAHTPPTCWGQNGILSRHVHKQTQSIAPRAQPLTICWALSSFAHACTHTHTQSHTHAHTHTRERACTCACIAHPQPLLTCWVLDSRVHPRAWTASESASPPAGQFAHGVFMACAQHVQVPAGLVRVGLFSLLCPQAAHYSLGARAGQSCLCVSTHRLLGCSEPATRLLSTFAFLQVKQKAKAL